MSGDVRRAQNEIKKHVTVGDLYKELKNVEAAFQRLGRIINNHAIRTDAIVKTLTDAGLFDMDAYKRNHDNLGIVQQFVLEVLGDEKKPMLERVRAAADFNDRQGEEFKVTEAYFPIRRWLADNPDGIDGVEIARIAQGFGYPPQEVLRVFVEERLMSVVKRHRGPE